MKWHYDWYGAEPVIRDEWLFDAQGTAYVSSVTMNPGALVCQGSSDEVYGVTAPGGEFTAKLAYNATVNSMATNCLGVLLEAPYAVNTTACSYMGTAQSTQANVGNTTPTPPGQYSSLGIQSCNHGKVIINPGAVYLCEQNIDSNNDIAVTRVSSTTVEAVAAGLAGNYVYFTAQTGSAAGVKGSLRFLYNVSVTSGALAKTLSGTATTSDNFVVIYGRGSRAPALVSTSDKVTCGTAAVTGGTTNLVIVETYIDADEGIAVLRPYTWGMRDNLHNVKGGNGPKFYYDLAMKSHLYGNSI